jgi:DNA-binding NarL/FixJ family response regulator
MTTPITQAAPQTLYASPPGLLRDAIETIVRRKAGYSLQTVCESGGAALEVVRCVPVKLALIDSHLSDIHFIELLHRIADCSRGTKCVVLLHGSHVGMAGNAIRAGAKGIVLTSDSVERVSIALDHACKDSIYLSPRLDSRRVFDRNSDPDDHDRLKCLSNRELQVYHLFIEGHRAKEIARKLGISAKTVDTYRSSLMNKLGVNSIANLVKLDFHRQNDRSFANEPHELSAAAASS